MQRGIDFIGVGVGAAIINKKGAILISQRGPKAKNERGKWEIPGGSVEFNETLRNALKREVYEEMGIEIMIHELLGVYDHILPEEKQHWVSPTFLCTISKGTPTIKEPKKCSGLEWFTIDEALQQDLSVITQYDISLLKKKPETYLLQIGSNSTI